MVCVGDRGGPWGAMGVHCSSNRDGGASDLAAACRVERSNRMQNRRAEGFLTGLSDILYGVDDVFLSTKCVIMASNEMD